MNKTALIVIDVQKGFDEYNLVGERDNPNCESNVARLIEAWRDADQPIVFVRHDSVLPTSVLRPGQVGNNFKDVVTGTPDLLVTKSVNSAFYGSPDLDAWLKAHGINDIAICGIQTNMCCETTARMGGNLGYNVLFAIDAMHTFAKEFNGTKISAAQLSQTTAVNLSGEFAEIVTTGELVSRVISR